MAKNDNTIVKEGEIQDINEFLPIADAEQIASAEKDDVKPNIFTNSEDVDIETIISTPDKEEEEEKKEGEEIVDKKEDEKIEITEEDKKNTEDILANLDEEEDKEDDNKTKGTKSTIEKVFEKLIEQKGFEHFDDEKPIEDYTHKDWLELIQVNIDTRESKIKESTPKEFFEALSPEMQYAALHEANGNKDMQSVFKALAQTQETKQLDIKNEAHHSLIARRYLEATDFGKGDDKLIDEQITEWTENGLIEKKAETFKPKLDKLQDELLEVNLKKQEDNKALVTAQKDNYLKNMYEALKPGELNGVKIDSKRQNMLWNELTTTNYNSVGGKSTNLLGKLLEEYQYGEKPRYDLIAEVTWLLADPDDYKKHLRQTAVNDENEKNIKKIKTEGERKLKGSQVEDDKEDKSRKVSKGLKKPVRNIFSSV